MIREDEVTVIGHLKDKMSHSDALEFDKLYNDVKAGVRFNCYIKLSLVLYRVFQNDKIEE